MSETVLRERSEIPAQYKWNAESIFADAADWEAEQKRVCESLPGLQQYQGRLAGGAGVLAEALKKRDELARRTWIVLVYAYVGSSVDTRDQTAAERVSQAQGVLGQMQAAAAFIEPEMIAIGEERIREWLEQEPALADYGHYVEDLFRKQAHVRSAEVEEVLGMLVDPFGSVSTTMEMLTNADFQFPPARTSDGRELAVTQGTLEEILASSDREARRTAWEGYRDTYLAYRNTLANNLATSIKQNVFDMRARRHPSTLAASLFQNNIPVEVFHNLIGTFRTNLPTWQRYWNLRRRALGVDTLQPYDIWAPLTANGPRFSYEETVDWICRGLAPMGEDYVAVVRRGCLEERWVDVFPNRGKTAGAFSAGSPGTHPFIVTSFDGTIFSLSTLAHELGHSMHSYLAWKNQPFVYSEYSLFVAEVASNFHQALVRAYLLEHSPDPAFQMSVIEEAMSNFHRYFFIMPTLARFELEMHEKVERGEGLSADLMVERMSELFAEGYGEEMQFDRRRAGITWATFSHLYADYYVYQYATGISAAHVLANRILAGQPGAVEHYRSFLSAGGSLYPLDALKLAGVDLTSPQPVEETFALLNGLVDRLESLLKEQGRI